MVRTCRADEIIKLYNCSFSKQLNQLKFINNDVEQAS